MSTQQVIAKIVKLLALAEGKGTTPEEAAVAAATAQRLMTRYRIEHADLSPTEDDPIETTDNTYPSGLREGFVVRPLRWQRDLIEMLGVANSCLPIISSERRSKTKWVNLIGHKSDLEICGYLWTYLSREINRLARLHTKGWDSWRKRHFKLGAAHTIGKALLMQQYGGEGGADEHKAAIVRQSRLSETMAWFQERWPNANSAKPRTAYVDMDAYKGGRAAGAKVSIRKGIATPPVPNSRRLKA